jgi:hypothetical protein
MPPPFPEAGALSHATVVNGSYGLCRIKLEDLGEAQELDHIYPPLPSLDERDVWLVHLELFGQLRLGETRLFALLDEEEPQRLVVRGTQRTRHSSRRIKTIPI